MASKDKDKGRAQPHARKRVVHAEPEASKPHEPPHVTAKPTQEPPKKPYTRPRLHRNVLFDPDRQQRRREAATRRRPAEPVPTTSATLAQAQTSDHDERRDVRRERDHDPHEGRHAGEPKPPHGGGDHDRDDRSDRWRTAGPLRKIVERYYYFCDDDDDGRGGGPGGTGGGPGGTGGGPGGPGGTGAGPGSGTGGRPTRPPGVSNGRLGTGAPLGPGDLSGANPPGVWVGPRADMELPYLFMRANPGDLGARPVTGAPFWESPDIFILAGVDPDNAPDVPPQLGQIGIAGQPNTIYAHIWNFGRAAANQVYVEFYWVNPSLGIDAESVQLIAQTVTWLGAKGSGRSHALIKCPKAWTPTFVNGGHECLIVRIWDDPSDLPGKPDFDASWNRHVAQRNIHVVQPGAAAMKLFVPGLIKPMLAALAQPLILQVGKLYGVNATVNVARASPSSMPWLQLHSGTRGVFPNAAPPTGAISLSPPTATGSGLPSGPASASQSVGSDGQQLSFMSSDHSPDPGAAHVYRISASQNGSVFGGYTVVVLG